MTAYDPWIGPVPADLRIPAAERIVGGQGIARKRAAERLIRTAPDHGIDLNLLIGTGVGRIVRQVALFVPSAGRTAMMFLSTPGDERLLGDAKTQLADRVRVLHAGFGHVHRTLGDRVRLAQMLPEPQETWAIDACAAAGMVRVGGLAYLRRALTFAEPVPAEGEVAPGIEMRAIRSLDTGPDAGLLARALEASYIDTRDCPELCGLRETADVIESHRATGRFDPSTWWLVVHNGDPQGCVLMSHAPEHQTVELVYLGIGPSLRGRGLGAVLLDRAIGAVSGIRARELTCAVDRRNGPALRLYASRGFSEFTSREAFVQKVPPADSTGVFTNSPRSASEGG